MIQIKNETKHIHLNNSKINSKILWGHRYLSGRSDDEKNRLFVRSDFIFE